MRILVGLLVMAMLGSPAMAKTSAKANAKEKTKTKAKANGVKQAGRPFTGKLLRFKQLMALTPAKREAYIRGLTEVLVLMEGFNSKYVVADNQRATAIREQIAFLMNQFQVLPEANADKSSPGANFRHANYVAKMVPTYDASSNTWNCPVGGRFDYSLRACLANNEYGEVGWDGNKCPNQGTVKVPFYQIGTVACIPKANWAIIEANPERKAAILAGNYEPPSALRMAPASEQLASVLNQDSKGNPLPAGAATRATGISPTERQERNDAKKAREEELKAVTDKLDNAAGPPDERIAKETPPAEACVPPVQACKSLSEADRATAITRFRSTATYAGVDANVCIAGGFLSKYKTSAKKEGGCVIPRSITYKDLGTKSCDQGKVLCNPVLFCVTAQPAGSATPLPMFLCVDKDSQNKKNMQITKACARDYADVVAGRQRTDSKGKLDLAPGMPDLKGSACDPKNMPELAVQGDGKKISYQAQWDEMVADTEKMRDVWCGTSDFAALFCDECEVINDRLFQINKNAVGAGCVEAAVATNTVPAETVTTPVAPADATTTVDDTFEDADTID